MIYCNKFSQNDLLPGLRCAATGVSFSGTRILQNNLEFRGTSFFPCQSMYFLICASFRPTVEEKYPVLQMPSFSMYISLMNLNFFRKCLLDSDFNLETASDTATFGGNSSMRWT